VGKGAPHRASVVLPAFGVVMVGLSAARLLAGLGPGRSGPWLAVAVGGAGAGLAVWGFTRLRRARAAHPDRSWWGLLRAELVALGLAAVWLPIWTALPAEQRDGLVQSVREGFELVHVAGGHP
jgi:hypothetical protein